MRFAVVALAIVVPTGAFSAPVSAEFKGLAMGASYADVRSVLGSGIGCPAPSAKPKDFTCMYGGATYASAALEDLHVSFIAGKLAEVRMAIAPARFDAVLVAMREKFGPGRSTGGVMQNAYGAQFDQVEVAWSFPDGSSIFAMKYATATRGAIHITSAEERKRRDAALAKRKKPSADL